MSANPPLLSVEGLSKSYGGVHAVRGVSFSLATSEILALIGPNGAGKSTCFNMLNGQTAPDAGKVHVLGRDTTGLKPRQVWRLGVGRTFQITATFPTMTVRENVQVALSSHDHKLFNLTASMPRYARQEADRLLDLVDRAFGLGAHLWVLPMSDMTMIPWDDHVAQVLRELIMLSPREQCCQVS